MESFGSLWSPKETEGYLSRGSPRFVGLRFSVFFPSLPGWVPWPLVLALAVVMYLTVVELLEWRPHYAWWFWWLLLVFLTNFVGYLFLRAYGVYRRHKLERA